MHDPTTRRRHPRGLRPLLLRLHFYAGVFVGPFILVAAVTGLLYALIPQLDAAVYRHELTVDRIGPQRLPLADQLAAARTAHPEGAVESIRPPAAPDETTRITLAVDDVPPDYARTVFVDPYSGEVRGALTTYGEWMPVRAWFDELHRNLHLGALGRNYSELAASWLWVISLAGLVLWFTHRRDTRRLRRLAVPDRGTTGRRRQLSWHGALGVWTLAVLLGLSVTGITWSRYGGESVNLVQEALRTAAPTVDTAAAGHHHGSPAAAGVAGADTVLRTAESAGLRAPLWLYPPAAPGENWRVEENKRTWPTQFDAIAVDPGTGQLTDRVDFAEWPFLAKLTNWAIDAHMGVLFGPINQAVLILTALGLIAIVLLGYRMWWQRRPTRGTWARPRPPARGALRSFPVAARAGVVALALAVSWFLPLFGLSFAAFVAVDVAVAAATRRRAARLTGDGAG
ncbi:PepSY domain-containing protein [Mycobacterium sp. MYCO198283]|nr:PepSY domain-containing protein [Mycobacterium sp. MYCO198283]MCG5434034.1 PepSY domain-containing protein [Mycobacterium sp. MYCO198283]